ncbi:HAD family hydrolase [Pseudomonas costantinii]|uniref:HAD family hydrolase n=1 Tax=Pseudomonas costantinii TaxID=168469 RepID=UPI0015A2B8FE|nr:HAD family hydrolase [Pseudomonas costantinii]NVZ21309.1 HAD family hydrolase [Pseudomonas costantinii]
MRALAECTLDTFKDIRFVLTDMDETLTFKGRLAADTYNALERLQRANIRVIPVTAAPAGWCDQMARMWPVDGVIGENGGLFFRRGGHPHDLERDYWHQGQAAEQARQQRENLISTTCEQLPWARLAADQSFRQTSVAFDIPHDREKREHLSQVMAEAGAEYTFNNLWALAWFGRYDKLTMAQRVLRQVYGVTADQALSHVFYSGDSLNDAPMFGHFKHTLGVSTIIDCLDELPFKPAWVSAGAGGSGFVEAADAILKAQA